MMRRPLVRRHALRGGRRAGGRQRLPDHQAVAKDLFLTQTAVGRILQIKKVPFLVIGVLQDDNTRRGGVPGPQRDLNVFTPYTSILMRLDRRAQIEIGIKTDHPERLHDIQQDVDDLMEERRGTRKAEFRSPTSRTSSRPTPPGSRP